MAQIVTSLIGGDTSAKLKGLAKLTCPVSGRNSRVCRDLPREKCHGMSNRFCYLREQKLVGGRHQWAQMRHGIFTGLPFITGPNKFALQGAHNGLVQLSGTL